MNPDSLRAQLAKLVTKHGSQRAAAQALGLSQSYFLDLMRGRRQPGPKALKALGLEAAVAYIPRTAASDR